MTILNASGGDPVSFPVDNQAEPLSSTDNTQAQSAQDTELNEADSETYGQIVESSFLVGGSSVISIAIRILRTKAMAFLLGPAGFGLFALYGSIETLTENIADLGVNSSGVRQIAEAAASGDKTRIAQTATVLRRTSAVLGILGALFLIVFSGRISSLTFGTPEHTSAVCLLSLAVLCQLISYGQSALVQGVRRIGDMARIGVIGAFWGTIVSIPVVYFFRESGIVPSIVICSAVAVLTSWWYSRKVSICKITLSRGQMVQEARELLKLGSVFMMGGLLLTGVAYLIRVLIQRRLGLEAAGLYQSAWALGGIYVGLIIQAMAADFYPRLTAHAANDKVCNRLVNEQARVALLLATPGVIATLTFAPVIIAIFYTAKFEASVGMLRWICLGTMLQVVTWPMGFIVVAKGKRVIFFWCELICAGAYAALVFICITFFGLNGAGIAFFAYTVVHGLLHYPVVRHVSGFSWSRQNLRDGSLAIALIGLTSFGVSVMPAKIGIGIGGMALLLSCVYSVRVLSSLISFQQFPRPVRRAMLWLGVAPSGAQKVQGV